MIYTFKTEDKPYTLQFEEGKNSERITMTVNRRKEVTLNTAPLS